MQPTPLGRVLEPRRHSSMDRGRRAAVRRIFLDRRTDGKRCRSVRADPVERKRLAFWSSRSGRATMRSCSMCMSAEACRASSSQKSLVALSTPGVARRSSAAWPERGMRPERPVSHNDGNHQQMPKCRPRPSRTVRRRPGPHHGQSTARRTPPSPWSLGLDNPSRSPRTRSVAQRARGAESHTVPGADSAYSSRAQQTSRDHAASNTFAPAPDQLPAPGLPPQRVQVGPALPVA